MTPEPHLDTITAYREAKKIRIGAHQAVEDKALQAYHSVYTVTGCEQRATAAYFETFNNFYHVDKRK